MSLVELRERTRTTFLPGQEENKGIAGRQGASASRPAELVGQTFEERSIAAAEELDLTITDEYVLKVLKTNGRVPALRIADLLKVSESTIRRSLKRLKDHGFIKRIGSNKAGYWKVLR
jgi:predicted HTH transcriptional regulator